MQKKSKDSVIIKKTENKPCAKLKIVVLAGNKRQYQDFLRENNLTEEEAVYGDTRHKIIGFHFNRIEVVGTFWQDVKRADEIYDEAYYRIRD